MKAVTAAVEAGLALPLAALNALRREALERLTEERVRRTPPAFHRQALPAAPLPTAYAPLKREKGGPFRLAARCRTAAQAEAALSGGAPPSLLIVPLSLPEETLRRLAAAGPTAVEIPRGLFGREETVRRLLESAHRAGIDAALCGNIGALPLAREAELTPLGGFGLNVTNGEAAAFYAERGLAALTLSPELAFRQLQQLTLPLPAGLLIYGRQPLMLTRNCPLRAAAEQKGAAVPCPSCGGNGRLTDRKGVAFPVACEDGPGSCTEVLNSLPQYWADRLDKLPKVDFLLLHFTGESPEETAEQLCRHRNGGPPPDSFTRGLYRQGVR